MVRSTATLGVCKILAKCWELLPPTIITDFLKKLVMELAGDTSSPDVRCSVFKVGDAVTCCPDVLIVLENIDTWSLLELIIVVRSHPRSKPRTRLTKLSRVMLEITIISRSCPIIFDAR